MEGEKEYASLLFAGKKTKKYSHNIPFLWILMAGDWIHGSVAMYVHDKIEGVDARQPRGRSRGDLTRQIRRGQTACEGKSYSNSAGDKTNRMAGQYNECYDWHERQINEQHIVVDR